MQTLTIRRRRTTIYTLFADLMTILVACFLAIIAAWALLLSKSKAVAKDLSQTIVTKDIAIDAGQQELSDIIKETSTKDGIIKELRGDTDTLKTRLTLQDQKLAAGKKALGEAIEEGAQKDGIINGYVTKSAGDREEIRELGETIKELHQQKRDIEDQLRSGPPVTMVILIDVTASMQDAIEELRTVMATLFEVLPNTSQEVEIGVLAFRNGVVSTLPLTHVQPRYYDGGKSQATVLEFLDGLQAEEGYTDHWPVFSDAMKMLGNGDKANPLHNFRCVVLGDVAPAELDEKLGFTQAERERCKKIIRGLETWAGRGPNNAVISLYARSKWAENDPFSDESLQWFKDIGGVSKNSAFYEDTSSLLRALLSASLN